MTMKRPSLLNAFLSMRAKRNTPLTSTSTNQSTMFLQRPSVNDRLAWSDYWIAHGQH
jgi:hypothetical protein